MAEQKLYGKPTQFGHDSLNQSVIIGVSQPLVFSNTRNQHSYLTEKKQQI